MIKRFGILFSLILFTGCVSVKNIPLNSSDINNIHVKTITTTNREKPDFVALTPTKAAFGLLGVPAQIIMGNKIIKDNNVEDPAVYMRKILANDLSKKYKLSPKSSKDIVVKYDKVDALSDQYNTASLLLDVRTINWTIGYFGTNWNRYRLIYTAQLRLIDTNSKKVLAESFCSSIPESIDNKPTYDELLANNAARLKDELKNTADTCIEGFRSKTLAL